ncbi:MAG: hypothetical protein ACJATN_000437, partial [Neolewinella sp.]
TALFKISPMSNHLYEVVHLELLHYYLRRGLQQKVNRLLRLAGSLEEKPLVVLE